MASRKEQKEQARAARLAAEQNAATSAARTRRLQLIGGAVVIAVAIVVVLIAISAGNNSPAPTKFDSKAALTADKYVDQLLAGIPESGNTLGKPSAPVTVTFFGDLECSACDIFATPPSFRNPEGETGTGIEEQLINQDVRNGTVKLVYRSVETASGDNPDPNAFNEQQVAAEAAGLQDKEWYYIELWYDEQGAEGSDYVTSSFIDGMAKQVPELNYAQWLAALSDSKLLSQVNADGSAALAAGATATPTLDIQGPDGEKALPSGVPSSFSEVQSAINSVN
jgi:protein-disulfide isomerase